MQAGARSADLQTSRRQGWWARSALVLAVYHLLCAMYTLLSARDLPRLTLAIARCEETKGEDAGGDGRWRRAEPCGPLYHGCGWYGTTPEMATAVALCLLRTISEPLARAVAC
jgi:hypothetical protein